MMGHREATADLLQSCLERLQAGEAMSSILSDVPEHANALRPLLQTALELKQWKLPRLSPEHARWPARALREFQSKFTPHPNHVSMFSRACGSIALSEHCRRDPGTRPNTPTRIWCTRSGGGSPDRLGWYDVDD
jgi:hypothetical protein